MATTVRMSEVSRTMNSDEPIVITSVQRSSLPQRRRRYLVLMGVRVLAVPGLLITPIPLGVQIPLLVLATVSQFVAVITANTPDMRSEPSPHLLADRNHAKPPQLL